MTPRTRASIPGMVLMGMAAGCATPPPPPVPVSGESDVLALLEGVWEGDYVSPATSRSGSIRFELQAGADTAFGDVWMYPDPTRTRPDPNEPPSHPRRSRRSPFGSTSSDAPRALFEGCWFPIGTPNAIASWSRSSRA